MIEAPKEAVQEVKFAMLRSFFCHTPVASSLQQVGGAICKSVCANAVEQLARY
jgi:hypothetical protein